MTDDLESRLRASLHAEAAAADQTDQADRAGHTAHTSRNGGGDSLTAIRARARTVRRRRNTLAALGAVAVVVASFAGVNRLAGDDDRDQINVVDGPDSPTTTLPAPSASSTPTTSDPTTTSRPDEQTTTTEDPPDDGDNGNDGGTAGPDVLGDGFQPLWPFATRADAEAWQRDTAGSGSQAWHLDPELTALSFTQGFLGFTEIDQIVGTSDVRADEAWVSVGYSIENGAQATSATVHLMRFGDGDQAPWEVVGTRDADTDLFLERPDYATTARSPMTVGGYITGVDENLRVTVRQSSSAEPLGDACCINVGGTDTPWETQVSFSGASDPAVTVVVSTGGHVQEVERFAITGLRS